MAIFAPHCCDADNCVAIDLVIGDHSGSHSERYEMRLGTTIHHVSPQFGQLATNVYYFVKGKVYPFEVRWIDTNMESGEPDYDYTATIGGYSNSVTSTNGYVISDPDGILGEHEESTYDFAAGKTGTLYIIRVDVVQTQEYACVHAATNTPLNLTSDSWTNCTWTISPDLGTNGALFASGPTAAGSTNVWSGTNVWVAPGNTPTNFIVTAYANELTNCFDTCTVSIVEMELFRNEACTNVLDDWPAETGKLRSPKYIFGKDDNLYIRVNGAAGFGDSNFTVQVTSETDTNGVEVSLSETNGTYVNVDASDEFLRLSDSSNDPGTNLIKVVEEEVLTLKLKVGGSEIGCATNVMVDRGEFASATARSWDSLLVPPGGPDRTTNYWNYGADRFDEMITNSSSGDLVWWQVGNVRGTYAGSNDVFAAFVIAAGEDQADNRESDIFYSHSHGVEEGDLYGTEQVTTNQEQWELIIDASSSDLDGIWTNDTDWAIIKACSVLNHTNTGRPHWQGALTNAGRPAHGILSFEDPSVSDYKEYIEDFWDEIGAEHTVITAWINANSGVSQQPYGIVYHTENADDRLRKPNDGVSLTADATGTNFTYAWRDDMGTTGSDYHDNVGNLTHQYSLVWGGRTVKQAVSILTHRPSARIGANPHALPVAEETEGFDLVRRWHSGRVRMSREIDLKSPSISVEDASAIARGFIERNSLPIDALIHHCRAIWVQEPKSNPRVIGYAVTLRHYIDGVLVAGDSMEMVIQSDGVKLFSALWHNITVVEASHVEMSNIDQQALQKCMDWLRSRYDKPSPRMPRIRHVRPAYYVGGRTATDKNIRTKSRLIWYVQFEKGIHVCYDPSEGEIVDEAKHYHLQRGTR